MTKDVYITKMNFRKWPDGTIDALMPEEIASYDGHCTVYSRIGQHSPADYSHCITSTSPASPEEYAPLLKELTGIGYNVQVIKK